MILLIREIKYFTAQVFSATSNRLSACSAWKKKLFKQKHAISMTKLRIRGCAGCDSTNSNASNCMNRPHRAFVMQMVDNIKEVNRAGKTKTRTFDMCSWHHVGIQKTTYPNNIQRTAWSPNVRDSYHIQSEMIVWWRRVFHATYEGVTRRLELVLLLPYLSNMNCLGRMSMTSRALKNFRLPTDVIGYCISSMKPKLTFVCVKLILTNWSTHCIDTRRHVPQTCFDSAFEILYCLRQMNSRILQYALNKTVEFWRNCWNNKICLVLLPCTLAVTARCHASTRDSKETVRLEDKHVRSLHINEHCSLVTLSTISSVQMLETYFMTFESNSSKYITLALSTWESYSASDIHLSISL